VPSSELVFRKVLEELGRRQTNPLTPEDLIECCSIVTREFARSLLGAGSYDEFAYDTVVKTIVDQILTTGLQRTKTPTVADEPPQSNTIRREGAVWIIRYGEEHGTFPAKDFSALETVAKMVARPNEPLELKDLMSGDIYDSNLFERPDLRDHVVDQPAVADLKRRWEELKRDMEVEDDPLVKEENNAEIGRIAEELKKIMGPGRRMRKLGRTPKGQAWDALTHKLRRLWPRLREEGMAALSAHLETAIHIECPHISYRPPASSPRLKTV
jgi:hypothetical protein